MLLRYKRNQRTCSEVSDHPDLSKKSSRPGKNLRCQNLRARGGGKGRSALVLVYFDCHSLESSRKREAQNEELPRSDWLVGMSVGCYLISE